MTILEDICVILQSVPFPGELNHSGDYDVEDDRRAVYFSREYKRPFGQPPMRDVERMRELATA
jgi:hypothetical protein